MAWSSLTDLQLVVMEALWSLREGTLADVHGAIAARGKELAPTTVATMLQRLSKQGWVSAKKVGRTFIYRPQVERHEAAQGALQRLVRSFFGGSVSAVTAQLLKSEQLTAEDIEEMRRLIEEKES
jgi:predicted transcriptional regulator